MTLIVRVVIDKGFYPRLRLRLGLWSLRWRLRLGDLGVSLGLGQRCPWKGVKVVLETLRLGNPDRLLGRILGWLLKDAILGLIWLKGLGGVGLGKTLFRGKLTPLHHLVQHTLKIGSGVLIPQPEPILLLELLDQHPKLRFSGRNPTQNLPAIKVLRIKILLLLSQVRKQNRMGEQTLHSSQEGLGCFSNRFNSALTAASSILNERQSSQVLDGITHFSRFACTCTNCSLSVGQTLHAPSKVGRARNSSNSAPIASRLLTCVSHCSLSNSNSLARREQASQGVGKRLGLLGGLSWWTRG